MKRHYHLTRRHFSRNKLHLGGDDRKENSKSDGGIIMQVGEDDAMNTTDGNNKTAKVVAVGPTNEYGKTYKDIKIGSVIIFDAYVGMAMNANEVTDSEKYRIMFSNDILGFIIQK
jgi:co-chaperonin GroES (HSP10)